MAGDDDFSDSTHPASFAMKTKNARRVQQYQQQRWTKGRVDQQQL